MLNELWAWLTQQHFMIESGGELKMPIAVICPSCGHCAGAKEEWIGRKVKCPGCGERILVEEAAPAEPPARPAPRQRLPAQERPPVQERPPAQERPLARPRQTQQLVPQRRGLASRPKLSGSSLGDPRCAASDSSRLGSRSVGTGRTKGFGRKIIWIAAGAVGGLLLLAGAGLITSGALSRSTTAPTIPVVSGTTIVGGTPASDLPAWSPDPALVSQLDREVSFDRYSLRLPAGYEPLNITAARPTPRGVQRQTWAWCDKPAADGTRHVIQARLASASDMPHTNNLDAEVNAYLQNAQADASSAKFESGTKAKGQVCGGPFARLTYSVATPQATVHAISYLGFDGENRMLTLICACKEAEGTEASKLLEASLLSIKRN